MNVGDVVYSTVTGLPNKIVRVTPRKLIQVEGIKQNYPRGFFMYDQREAVLAALQYWRGFLTYKERQLAGLEGPLSKSSESTIREYADDARKDIVRLEKLLATLGVPMKVVRLTEEQWNAIVSMQRTRVSHVSTTWPPALEEEQALLNALLAASTETSSE